MKNFLALSVRLDNWWGGEPFRVLFPLGVLCGVVGVSHWLFYAMQWSASSSNAFHASVQIGAYLYCFIAGFLMTALPRFAASFPTTSGELLTILGLLVGHLLSVSLGQWVVSAGCWIGLLMSLLWFAGRRFATRRLAIGPPVEFVWVPIGALLGIAGAVLSVWAAFGAAPPWAVAMARPLAQQGFLLAIVMGVAGFMAPRLLGRAAGGGVTPPGLSPAQILQRRRRRLLIHLAGAAMFLLSFMLEGHGWIRPAYLVRAAVVTAMLEWLVSLPKAPRTPAFYARLLWVSLWMVVLGLWGAGWWPRYRVAMLHMTFLGGASLMTFAVGTMVVLSHAGEGERLQRPLWVLRIVAVGVGVAVVARVLADLVPSHFFQLLAAASLAWLVAGMSWLVFVMPFILRPIAGGTFERLHEEATQRLRMATDVSPGR